MDHGWMDELSGVVASSPSLLLLLSSLYEPFARSPQTYKPL